MKLIGSYKGSDVIPWYGIIYIIFRNYDDFLSDENEEAREILLTILDDAATEWKRMDGEGKSIRIQIEPSELAEDDLETLGIDYKQA